jgi:hypothetical protein
MTAIATYEAQVSDLLHDPTNVIWGLTQVDRYINEARRQLVMDTGCLRSLQTAYFTQGVEAYTFGAVTGAAIVAGGINYLPGDTVGFSGGGGSGVAATLGVTGGAVTSITFTNFGSGYTSAPAATITTGTGSGASIAVGAINVNTYDVLGINLFWGASRYPLRWRAWSVFSQLRRQWSGQQSQPDMWAVYGDTQIYIGLLPNQTYQGEVDTIILPIDIAGATVDPIPVLLQDAIKFYAAHLAKFNIQAFGEASMFKKQYADKRDQLLSVYTGRVPNPYSSEMPQ